MVPRSRLALGGRAAGGPRLRLRRRDGVAHPAYGPSAEHGDAAGRHAVAGPRVRAAILRLWPCRRHCCRLHGPGARSGGAAQCLFSHCVRALANLRGRTRFTSLHGEAPPSRRGRRPRGHRHPGAAHGSVHRRLQPPRDRLHRCGAGLVAPGPSPDALHARPVRLLGRDGQLLGPAELDLDRH